VISRITEGRANRMRFVTATSTGNQPVGQRCPGTALGANWKCLRGVQNRRRGINVLGESVQGELSVCLSVCPRPEQYRFDFATRHRSMPLPSSTALRRSEQRLLVAPSVRPASGGALANSSSNFRPAPDPVVVFIQMYVPRRYPMTCGGRASAEGASDAGTWRKRSLADGHLPGPGRGRSHGRAYK